MATEIMVQSTAGHCCAWIACGLFKSTLPLVYTFTLLLIIPSHTVMNSQSHVPMNSALPSFLFWSAAVHLRKGIWQLEDEAES